MALRVKGLAFDAGAETVDISGEYFNSCARHDELRRLEPEQQLAEPIDEQQVELGAFERDVLGSPRFDGRGGGHRLGHGNRGSLEEAGQRGRLEPDADIARVIKELVRQTFAPQEASNYILKRMALDVAAIQQVLAREGLDGWLLYDFHGSNPIAARLAGLTSGAHMTTRRWYYLIPAAGRPRGLVHAIERHNLDALPGDKAVYAGRQQLESGLDALLSGTRRVAMEYSRANAIPYLSRVDAGTAEAIRARGVEIVSSGDLVQQFEATWTEAQYTSHRVASDALYRIKDRAFEWVAALLKKGTAATEYDLQQRMVDWFADEELVSDSAPVVAVRGNAGNPHYLPTAERSSPITPDEVLLLDLWGKRTEPGAVFADITWVGFTGGRPPDALTQAFAVAGRARDAAIALVQEAAGAGRELRGWEVDRAARTVLQEAGFGAHILHRTGHSLGETVHGNGVHLDDYETHDDRRILPGTGFTIEPGLYFDTYGVRTEVNMFRGEREATVTGPRQREIVTLG
jgi:Xaa-Pro dipeptidase